MSYNETLSINIILACQSISTALHTWKFKGKQLLSNLINYLTQYQILFSSKLVNSQTLSEVNLYQRAKQKCLKESIQMIVSFQNCFQKYSEAVNNLNKLQKQSRLQKEYLTNILLDFKGTQKQKEYHLLITQLLQLTLNLCDQYQAQKQLIQISKDQIIGKILNFNPKKDNNSFSISYDTLNWCIRRLQIMLMNLQYQTQINSKNRDQFIQTLSKISNKRGQLNK